MTYTILAIILLFVTRLTLGDRLFSYKIKDKRNMWFAIYISIIIISGIIGFYGVYIMK